MDLDLQQASVLKRLRIQANREDVEMTDAASSQGNGARDDSPVDNSGSDTDADGITGGDGGHLSEADSDQMELEADIERLDLLRAEFVAQQRGDATILAQVKADLADRRRLRRGRRRGPRRAARPTPDIVYRLSQANRAYATKDYDTAVEMLREVIRINAETYDAWTLLSNVFDDMGQRDHALTCLVMAAHLQPKDASVWVSTAAFALEGVDEMDEDDDERAKALDIANMCYSAAVRAAPDFSKAPPEGARADVDAEERRLNLRARQGKADVALMQGYASRAAREYVKILEMDPYNIYTIRNLADVALELKDAQKSSSAVVSAYGRLIQHLQAGKTFSVGDGEFVWSDLRLYLEHFEMLQRWADAAIELKRVSRWLLGRAQETYWDKWKDDDREWDMDDDRRDEVPDYEAGQYELDRYGTGLPVDLRAKLMVYRLRLNHDLAAAMHMPLLDPTEDDSAEKFGDFPDCLKDVGSALLSRGRPEAAIHYFLLYRKIAEASEDVAIDAEFSVKLGKCFNMIGDKASAEECFLAAIEDDEESIEARLELANLYENDRQRDGQESAYLLVLEAEGLEIRRRLQEGAVPVKKARGRPRKSADADAPPKIRKKRVPRPTLPGETPGEKTRTYRPRRYAAAEQMRDYELERSENLRTKYGICQELKARMGGGDAQTKAAWMDAAKELVDDFRSFRAFYPWDKFVQAQGYGNIFTSSGGPSRAAGDDRLAAMAARLEKNLAPQEDDHHHQPNASHLTRHDHRGIPFDGWLDLLLEYAVSLAQTEQSREAYIVCHAARDSIVYKSKENSFLIHVAWAACAVYAGDEEMCVNVGRYFMKEYDCSDSYRMFAALCRVCQSPVSWYTSGPAQKFILRQIKRLDVEAMADKKDKAENGQGGANNEEDGDGGSSVGRDKGSNNAGDGTDPSTSSSTRKLDVMLLMMYGHVLFSSTSYTFALNYFGRAAAIDPDNPMVNLTLGLAYLHYGLKRQASNRQYLAQQGLAFLFRYHDARVRAPGASPAERQEALFNLGRAYHLLGLGDRAVGYYARVLEVAREAAGEGNEAEGGEEGRGKGGKALRERRRPGPVVASEDLVREAALNIRNQCLMSGNIAGARAITREWLVL